MSKRCEFNCGVECAVQECDNCGWNPKVAQERIERWCEKRKHEQTASKEDENNK